jgi:predicted Ser/Thr protein kinase
VSGKRKDETSTFSGRTSVPAAEPVALPLLQEVLAARYAGLEELGRGGMGVVFRAEDRQLERRVALKVIRPDRLAEPSVIERFKRESAIAQRIAHPNVCRVLDAGQAGDTLYISMEYLEGVTLKALLEEMGPLPLADVLRFGAQLASALEAIHREGIVHRDLKPQNILISGERAFVMDFGVAYHPAFGELTSSGRMPGSLAYFSPEQANGTRVAARSDVYALGLVLFEMCTGRRAPGDDGELPLALRAKEHCTRPSALFPAVPPELDAIVLKCLSRDPRKRFSSAAAVERALAGVKADLESGWQRRRRARRVRWGLAVACVAAVAAATLPPERGILAVPLRRAGAVTSGRLALAPSREPALCRVVARLDAALARHTQVGAASIPQAWTAAQELVALDPQRSALDRWQRFFDSQRVAQERLWRKYPEPSFPPHLGATAWVFLALARMGSAAEPADLAAFLAEQQANGAWPLFGGAGGGENASTYATAMALLALHEQRRLHRAGETDALERAIARAEAYLLATHLPGRARWSDYPSSEPKRSVSALVVHALHEVQTPQLVELDRHWLRELPAAPARPRDFEASNRTIRRSDGTPLQSDDMRYYELPWSILATVHAYPSGSWWQRASALRWIERVLAEADPAAGIVGDDGDAWIASELLLAFRRLRDVAGLRCPAS